MRRLIALGTLVVGILGNQATTNTNAVSTITSTVVPVVKVVNSPDVGLVPRSIVLEWEEVAICETGYNWTSKGPLYSGGLGITNTNWIKFGGRQFASNASMASPVEQIYIARKIEQGAGLVNYVPDQWGCGRGW